MRSHLLSVPLLTEVGRCLRAGFFMFWETLWALVLGFTLSGVVQTFASRSSMQRRLGRHDTRSLARASGYGMVSSSCSYAAAAMARSLVAKGADFIAAMVFMFASTNLVVELGIVLVILLGWQFLAAQFVGGALMIVLFALLGAHVLRGRWLTDARATATATATDPHDLGMDEPLEHPSPSVRSLGAWADASSHAVGDVTMLRRELLIGFTVAGVLSVAVPQRWWSAVFLHGHGVWTEIENALVAPLVAVVSFVCSIGNVPLAASLWQGGVSFGGVVAFLFADLIALPLVFIYRRYYGGRFTLRLVAVFYVVMAGAGLVVGSVFTSLGLVPASHTSRAVPAQLAWNYTTFLNIVFCAVALGVYVLYRNRDRLGGGAGLAIDPVCGMQVRTAEAPARSVVDGTTHWFCSERCQARFAGRSPDPVPAAAEAPTFSSDGTSRP